MTSVRKRCILSSRRRECHRKHDPLAQAVEHLTLIKVSGVRISDGSPMGYICGRGGMADALDLGSSARVAYEFKSLRPHYSERLCAVVAQW